MNPAQLLSHFDRISEATNAIPRLRRFIFNLAVRGKLVEQDPRDEPASELLKRIQGEKTRLLKEGKIKGLKSLAITDTAKEIYKIPSSWKLVPLGETVNSHLGGGTPSKNNSTYWEGDILWASVKDVGKGRYIDETIDRITEAGLADSSSNLIPPGSLIVVTRMGLGKVSINRVPIAINQDLRALSLSSLVSIDYHYIFFKTHGFEGTGLTVKGIKVEELLNIAFPLPPLAEQHRIVAKVDELMALCDRLEAAQAERESRRDRLAAASLYRLNNGADADAFRDHARFFFNHLPRLTTRTEHIQQVRQTILNLAVRGKLVPQAPNDEPADNTLIEISSRDGGDTNGEGKLKTAFTRVPDEETPFRIPYGWTWTRIGCLCNMISGKGFKADEYSKSGARLFQIANVSFGKTKWETLNYLPISYNVTYPELVLNVGDLVMALNRPLLNRQMKAAIIGEKDLPAILYQRVGKFLFYSSCVLPEYFFRYLQSLLFIEQLEQNLQGSDQPFINKSDTVQFLIPLPPLTEQQCIVAKVDELLALCDRLEGELTITQTESRRLLEATLYHALSA